MSKDRSLFQQIGDIVEIHEIVEHGPDLWIAAQIVAKFANGFSVKALKGAFDSDGHVYMALRYGGASEHPAQWRKP